MARRSVERKAMSETTQPPTKQSEVRNRVLDLIEQLGVGDAIPSERQLTSELGVSRLTVRAALDELVREGMLIRRHGSGTFVSEPKIAQELTMTSFTEDMRRRGMVPGSRTLDIHVTPAGAHLGRLLHVSPSEPVVIISRLRLADHETMAIETLHVRESLVPGISAADLERQRHTILEEELPPIYTVFAQRPFDDLAEHRGNLRGEDVSLLRERSFTPNRQRHGFARHEQRFRICWIRRRPHRFFETAMKLNVRLDLRREHAQDVVVGNLLRGQ